MKNDFYGAAGSYTWFIGVVKDVSDPLNSNRVRVRIKGIHPEDPDGDGGGGGSSPGAAGGGGSGGSNGGPSGSTTSDAPTTSTGVKAPLPPHDDLPTSTQLNKMISKHFTLAQLTVGTTVTGRSGQVQRYIHLLDEQTIKNLSNLAVNVLDPIKEQFPGMTITSGWRPRPIDTHGNHASGLAADVQATNMTGKGVDTIWHWVKNNLKGRYSFNYNEKNHVHVQMGGGSAAGSLANPVDKR